MAVKFNGRRIDIIVGVLCLIFCVLGTIIIGVQESVRNYEIFVFSTSCFLIAMMLASSYFEFVTAAGMASEMAITFFFIPTAIQVLDNVSRNEVNKDHRGAIMTGGSFCIISVLVAGGMIIGIPVCARLAHIMNAVDLLGVLSLVFVIIGDLVVWSNNNTDEVSGTVIQLSIVSLMAASFGFHVLLHRKGAINLSLSIFVNSLYCLTSLYYGMILSTYHNRKDEGTGFWLIAIGLLILSVVLTYISQEHILHGRTATTRQTVTTTTAGP